jgi:tetratricopeptide (TPR) repeat protein
MQSRLLKFSICIALLFTPLGVTVARQITAPRQGSGSVGDMDEPVSSMPMVGPTTFDATMYGTITVFLRDEDGKAITTQKVVPIVRIVASSSGTRLPNLPNATGEFWVFRGMRLGNDYEVLVSIPGYYNAREPVHLPNTNDASADVIVLMRPVDQELVYRPPNSDFPLAPKAQKEIQHALDDLQRGQNQSSQKHTQKALQIAPDHPYVQYVMGLTYVLNQQFKEAKPYLEKSVSGDSRDPQALSALGTVRYRLGDDPGAVQVLSKAVQLDSTMWKAEWTLAVAYLSEKKYAEARDHAQQAMNIGKDKAGQVQLVLGEAFAGLGDREQAAKLLDQFAVEYPKDPNAASAVKWADLMRHTVEANVPIMDASLPASLGIPAAPAIEVPPRADWAPPDVDAAKPFAISEATCPLENVLNSAGKNAEQFVSTLEEFSATEQFQAIEIKRDGSLDKPSSQDYNYLVFVQHVTPTIFQVNEVREQRSEAVTLSARVSDLGVPGLALAFHPAIQDDLEWQCEGLGKWNDQPAWVVHFRQRPDRPNVLAMFTTPSHTYALPLKGRAWVSEQGGQILHLDTDLVKEIAPLDLKREHFSIDYKLVSFQKHNVDLWLPENVDTYIQYQGHFLHHYHHFTNFKLFWVGASQKISEPKEATQQQNQRQQPQQ